MRHGLVVTSFVVAALVWVAQSPAAALMEAGERAAPASVVPPAHIVVIMLENKEYSSVIGSSRAPFLDALARHHVLLTDSFAVGHPSLPNYLALTSGSTFGVTSDCVTCYFAGRNIVDQLEAHHVTWKAYMQALPAPCFMGAEAGSFPHLYAAKHDPFMHYRDVRSSPTRCHQVVPLSQLSGDLTNGRLPRFSFISPDECFDMHSCPIGVGDRWLSTLVPPILAHLGASGLLIVAFDEGSSSANCCGVRVGGGHVAVVLAGPGARLAARIGRAVDHYSVLRLIEDAWGFLRLRHAASPSTPTIVGWRRP